VDTQAPGSPELVPPARSRRTAAESARGSAHSSGRRPPPPHQRGPAGAPFAFPPSARPPKARRWNRPPAITPPDGPEAHRPAPTSATPPAHAAGLGRSGCGIQCGAACPATRARGSSPGQHGRPVCSATEARDPPRGERPGSAVRDAPPRPRDRDRAPRCAHPRAIAGARPVGMLGTRDASRPDVNGRARLCGLPRLRPRSEGACPAGRAAGHHREYGRRVRSPWRHASRARRERPGSALRDSHPPGLKAGIACPAVRVRASPPGSIAVGCAAPWRRVSPPGVCGRVRLCRAPTTQASGPDRASTPHHWGASLSGVLRPEGGCAARGELPGPPARESGPGRVARFARPRVIAGRTAGRRAQPSTRLSWADMNDRRSCPRAAMSHA
jgi:hypothetical protein